MAFICLTCVCDESLRNLLETKKTEGHCEYCGTEGLVVDLQDVAGLVDGYLREYCCFGETVPRFDGDDDNVEYVQEGDELLYFLQEELGMEPDPVKDLIEILKERDPDDPRDGGVPFYDDWQAYQRRHISSIEYDEEWKEFADGVKHSRRFFDDTAKVKLERILGVPGGIFASELPFVEIGPGIQIAALYRARRANSENEAEKFLGNPQKELGFPESEIATAGRMNPEGISVFYGALTEETAIAEVRPFAGSLVVVGRFRMARKLRLLDFSRIGIGFTGSIFHPEYEQRAARLHFLQSFHSLIAKPVLPREERLEYLPTQAVAEYIANILGFDGILYASVQTGGVLDEEFFRHGDFTEEELGRYNIVLFGGALNAPIFEAGTDQVVRIDSVKYNYSRKPFLEE